MITKLSAQHLKGCDFSLLLGAVTLITGRNRRGKTARLDAVRLGLLGRHPRLGKQAGATARLASADSMSVNLLFDVGLPSSLTWSRNGEGWTVNGEPPFRTPEVLLDFKQFTGLSGPERLKYVIERTDISGLGFTLPALIAAIEAANPDPDNYTPAVAKAMASLATEVGSVAAKLQSQGQAMPAVLSGVLADLKSRLAVAKKVLAEQTAAITGAARQNAAGATVAPPRAKPVIEAELESLRKSLSQVEHERQSITEAEAAHQKHQKRRVQLEEWLAKVADPTAAIAELQQAMDALQPLLADHKSRTGFVAEALGIARGKLTQANDASTKAEAEVAEVREALRNLAQQKCCPNCGSKGKNWKSVLERTLGEALSARTANLESATKALTEASQEVERLKVLHHSTMEDDMAHENRRKLYDQHAADKAAKEKTQANRAKAQAELTGLAKSAPAPDTTKLPALTDRLNALNAQIFALEQEKTRAIAAATDALRREQAKTKQAQSEADLEAIKAAIAVVTTQQEDLVAKSMARLLEVANRFTLGILEGPLAYVEGELGYWALWNNTTKDGQWVSLDTFSGTEEAVAFIGLSVALAQEAPLKIVLMDEMGVMDSLTAPKVLDRMKALVAEGVIHQFIGADPHLERYAGTEAINGVTVEKVQ